MTLRITLNYEGVERIRDFDGPEILLGRLGAAEPGSLDLSPDVRVSRQHAVIQIKEDGCWLSDLGSRAGTLVNGREIRGQGECRIFPEDTIQLGETTLRLTPGPVALSHDIEAASTPPILSIVRMVDTERPLALSDGNVASPVERRLSMLLDLPAQLSAQSSQSDLLQVLMGRVVELMPAAKRGALLLRDSNQDALVLKAYVSADEPAVSETLARRALTEKRAFIWRLGKAGDATRSLRELKTVTGMYAPIIWQDHAYGVICVDSPEVTDSFQDYDLQFLIAIGQYAAMSLAHQESRDELRRNATLVDRLLANFSPKVRAVLLDQARLGKLRPGGTKSEVTVLFCDLCGFTKSCAQMDAHDVVDMLNDYFQIFVETIVSHNGTVDKFLGDAVLAVFGSPDADPEQHQHAIRAALALQQAVQATSQLRATRGDVACQVRIGLHCGEVFHGFVGALDRLEFTVVGDAVNRACRYCEAAGPGEILISSDVFQRVFSLIKANKMGIHTKEGESVAYRLNSLK